MFRPRRLTFDAAIMDPAELTNCFDRNAPALLLYARQWLDSCAAEDVVQEAFVRLMLARKRPQSVKAWLYRATRNLAVSQWRSGRRRQVREQVAAREEPVFEESVGRVDGETAVQALQDLPASDREVIVLRIWGQLKLAEIAEITGSPISSVFHQYQQGLREIRKKMGVPCKNHND